MMSLVRAFLCLEHDCQTVYDAVGADSRCPRCGSQAVMPLARWLNAEPEEVQA